MKDGIHLYTIEKRETFAETSELRVHILTLAPGQFVPWHCHTRVNNTFFCMEGPMQVDTLNPPHIHVLQQGDTYVVPPGKPHFVRGVDGGRAKYAVFQGVGTYDYEPVEEPRSSVMAGAETSSERHQRLTNENQTDRAGADDPWQAYRGDAARHEIWAKVPSLSVHFFELGAWQCRPWHYHNQITDTFFCIEGPMRGTDAREHAGAQSQPYAASGR